mmetsp:Transcript_87448/g.136870  ORF Transcript_87448/g.136870 Transcript_87448/m.136870 type:complete len:573 (+) Transcript_87448:66-1784(+)
MATSAPSEQFGVQLAGKEDAMMGMTRSMVSMQTFQEAKADYEAVFEKFKGAEDTPEYRDALTKCHEKNAQKAASIVRVQRGLYVKAAQFVCSLKGGTGDAGIPFQYTQALREFMDHAPNKPIKDMAPALKECMKLGDWPDAALTAETDLLEIDELPIASASLAQVHRAVARRGNKKVAVKIQYPQLQKEMASDFAVFRTMATTMKPGGYDLMWIVTDFEKYLSRELDFELEAQNAVATSQQLRHRAPVVFVPEVMTDMSSKMVMTMEFCDDLIKADDPDGLRAAGLDVMECAQLLCDTFAEMIFIHGRVHADPHAGNVHFRVLEDKPLFGEQKEGSKRNKKKPQLVILDHGLYHNLQENDVRFHFCKYWRACCSKDGTTMQKIGDRFAGPLHRFLPLILSTYFVFGGSGATLSEIIAASKGQLPSTVSLKDVADFIVATREGGANLIGLVHSLGYTRGLLNALGFPEEKRISSMLNFATLGDAHIPAPMPSELSRVQLFRNRWHMFCLCSHIRILAPVCAPLIKYGSAERAPPLWLLMSFPVVLVASGVAASLVAWRSMSASSFSLPSFVRS